MMQPAYSGIAPATAASVGSAIQKYEFPYRMDVDDLARAYASLEAAFAAHDYLYVARFGQRNPELRGCALLMLGNRAGGERILDEHKIRTTLTCLYRAYAAWQDGEKDEAKRRIAEGRAVGDDGRFDRLETLVDRSAFRVVFYYDYHNEAFTRAFGEIADIETVMIPHLCTEGPYAMALDQPLDTVVPRDKSVDLVLIDDFKLMPVGMGNLGAPVVVWAHDIEWHHEFLDQVISEVDLVICGATSEALEVGRAFDVDTSVYFYPVHLNLPERGTLAEAFANNDGRATDIFYSGSIGYDFYIYKKQQVLSLAKLDERFKITISEGYVSLEELWQRIRTTKFSMMSSRNCNYVSSRGVEAVANGALYITEEDDATPYMFSESFDCFSTFRRDYILADVERHLNNYGQIHAAFRAQIPRFEAEFNDLLPRDRAMRARRFMRHALIMTYVEGNYERKAEQKKKSTRNTVFINEYNHFVSKPETAVRYVEQTKPPHWLRRAFAVKTLAMAQKKPDKEMFGDFRNALLEGIAAQPDSMALHLMLGLCCWYLGEENEAEHYFMKVTSGQLRLLPDDPMPIDLGRVTSFYWVNDARIRTRCPRDLNPLVPAGNIVESYAWGYLAYIARRRGDRDQALARVERSLELFPYNEEVQRIYLRIAFDFVAAGQKEWEDCFLAAYEAACHNDYTIFHDFAAPAFHILTTQGRNEEASEILRRLKLYLSRVKLFLWHHALYQELYPYNQHYGIPHSNAIGR